jgi:hypothetical protein
MVRQDLEALLEQGIVVLVRDNEVVIDNLLGISCGQDAAGKRMDITLSLHKSDPPDLYPALALSEMPKYVARQRLIAEKPYHVTLPDIGGSGSSVTEFDFRDLEALDAFLNQHGKCLEDVELLPAI